MLIKVKNIIKSIIQMTKEEKLIPIPKPMNTTELLKDRIALIIGGTGGIGIAIAEAFLRNGAKVIITGTKQDKLQDILSRVNSSNVSNIQTMILNVLDVNSLPSKVHEASNFFGRIDILVNSAGLVAHHDFFDITPDEYATIMDVNAKGTYFMCQAVSKYMIEKSIKGHILNITSSSALRPAWTPYQMSKWAVRGLTLGVADKLLPYGIIVNAIAPGPVATPMLGKYEGDSIFMKNQPSGRYAMPEEIANMAVMLVSDMCDLVVGDTLYMTGGSGNLSYRY